MAVTLLGRKIGMTQVYDDDGVVHGVTVLEIGPCQVLQVKTQEKDGYHAIQLGFADRPRRLASKAERGHVAKVNAEPKRFIREVRTDKPSEHESGATLTIGAFESIKSVDVIGTMKGRGYSGVVKRHGFHGLEQGHGVQKHHNAPGSIGCRTFPGRVIKGRRMSGRYGNCRNTVRNLTVVRIDPENNTMLVKGGVPGPTGGYVVIRETNKRG